MPTTNVSIGYGTLFEIADPATPDTWVNIAEAFDITPPPMSVAQVEATSNQSPNRSREFIPGLIEQQETSFSINYIPGGTVDSTLRGIVGKKRNCRLTFPNGVAMIFQGSLSGFEPDAPTEDRITASVTFTVSGGVIMAPVAAPRFLVAPSITGAPTIGGLLTLDAGVIAGATDFAVQWERSTDSGVGSTWEDITGSTALAHVPTIADDGELIRATVTASNASFNTDGTSAATAAVS